MLNNATNTQADALCAVVEAVEEALFVLRELYPRTLPTERRMIYSAAYGLIRIGSVIEQHRSQLEPAGPDYPWADWIDRRDNPVKRPDQVSVDEIARAVTEDAPQLVRDITGAEPHTGPKVRLEDLPLDDIADFCREWGIKEMCMIPREDSGMYFSGPFEGVELVLLVKYRDDSPAPHKTFTIGPRISEVISIKTHVGHLPEPDYKGGHWNHDEMMARSVPVYAE